MHNPSVKAYRSVQVSSCDPGQLLLLLHDKILSEVQKAVILLEDPDNEKDLDQSRYCLIKANLGVMELDRTLNFQALPELAESLHNLYLHMLLLLAEGMADGRIESLQRCHALLSQLRASWEEAARLQARNSAPDVSAEAKNLGAKAV